MICISGEISQIIDKLPLETGSVDKKLSFIQREVLVGLMLGDGYLKPSQDKHNLLNPATYSLTVLQSDAHKGYVFHLYEIFKEFVTTPPRYYEFNDSRNPTKVYKRWVFSTTLQSCFRFYGQQFYKIFYSNNKICRIKVVPKFICKILKERSLAYWYMDDGAAKWQGKSLGLRYCTDNFTEKEVQLLIKCLTQKFNLACTIQKKDGNARIYIKHQSYHMIKTLMYEYLIPEMVHKFPREY